MAIEIANFIHAAALFIMDDPPVLFRGDGLREVNPIVRTGAGNYELHLAQPIRSNVLGAPPVEVEGGVLATVYFGGVGNAQLVDCRISDADNSIVTCQMRDAAGALTDGGILQVVVFRLPTIV